MERSCLAVGECRETMIRWLLERALTHREISNKGPVQQGTMGQHSPLEVY